MVVRNLGSRCCTRRFSNWHQVLSSRSAQTCAVRICRLCCEHGVLCNFTLCSTCIHIRFHSWIRILLHDHCDVHRGAKQVETRNAWTRDVTVVHGLWRNRSTWQHAVWSSCRSIRSTLVIALRRSVGFVLGLVVQCFCTGCKKQISTESVTEQLAQGQQLANPLRALRHQYRRHERISLHLQLTVTEFHSFRFHTR